MRFMIVGGSGFLGTHLSQALRGRGHYVRVLDRTEPEPESSDDFVHGLVEAREVIRRCLCDIDLVFHLASSTTPHTNIHSTEAGIDSDLVGSIRLFEEMVYTGRRRVVFFSSGGAVYGTPSTLPVEEESPLNPCSAYGALKLAIEKYLGIFRMHHGLRPTILRIGNAYGPGQLFSGSPGIIGTALECAVTGRPLEVWGSSSVLRDYIYISDIVSFCILVAEQSISGLFNVGSGVGSDIDTVVKTVEWVTARTVATVPGSARLSDPGSVVLEISRARNIGWQPQVTLEEGIRQYYEWMRLRSSY